MKIFLTGGTGFIGGHFLRIAVARGHEILAQRRSSPDGEATETGGVCWIQRPLDSLEAADLKGCDAFVHLASPGVSPKVAEWSELMYWNVDVLVMLLRAGAEAGIGRFVVAGTFAEYGRSAEQYDRIPPHAPLIPTYAYAASKAAGSIAASAFAIEQNLALAYLRIFSAYGVGQDSVNFWPSLRAAALAGRDFEMTAGEQIRDYMPVEAVVAVFLDALTDTAVVRGKPFIKNVATGNPVTMREFAQFWWKKWDAKGSLRIGALPYRANEVMRYIPEV